MVQWLWLTWVAASVGFAAGDADISAEAINEQWNRMPKLYELDDYKECLSSPGGVFCLGSFQLRAEGSHALMDILQTYSSDKDHFNRTVVHRGYCISSRCGHAGGSPGAPERFARCVDRHTRQAHGLTARLLDLQYCRTGRHQRPVDALDAGFAYCVGLIVLANLLATAHDLLRSHDTKPNPYIQAWSLAANWRRLTFDHDVPGRDPALKMLNPLGGLKILCISVIILGHSLFMEHSSYMHNPEFLEKMYMGVEMIFANGTSVVQTFFLMSSFLTAYTMLRMASSREHHVSFHTLPYWLVHRIVRLLPVHMFMVGLSATWWSRVGDGPLWGPLVETQEAHCRASWWAHALFINNFIRIGNTCLISTWYVAADMQLYVVTCVLTVALARWRRGAALRVLAALLLVSVLANFLAAYYWDLKSFAAVTAPEVARVQYAGQRTLDWMYKMPWSSFPTALLGITFAFVFHHVQHTGYKVQDNMLISVLYHVSVPLMFAWFYSAFWTRRLTSPLATALNAALDGPVFAVIMAVAMFGGITNIGYIWNWFLSWRCWQVLGRMSLSLYLVHWTFHITQVALRPHVIYMSWSVIIGHWLLNLLLTFSSGLLVHLMIESPAQRCMNTLLFTRT